MADDLFQGVARGNPAHDEKAYAAPAARFRAPSEFAGADAKAGGVFLGVVGGMAQGEGRGRHVKGGSPVYAADDRHIVTIAGSRAGKGRSVIVPNMLHYPGSVVAFDPKGELATLTARYRAERLGHAVHVLDPFGVVTGRARKYRTGFNPLRAMRPRSMLEDAALISDGLVPVSEKDPHWDESARAFIEGAILHVATDPQFEKRRTLAAVHELVGLGVEIGGVFDFNKGVRGAMGGNTGPESRAVRMAAADLFDKPENERGSVVSTARRHLRFLGFHEIAGIVSDHEFELDSLKTGKTTVYLCLPARHMGTCARWLRLFVNLTLQAMERSGVGRGLPVLMILDEFATLGHMRQIEDAAGQIAGFGVRLWPVLQDLGQLKALYKDRWETFLGNAGVLQFFGNADLSTLEWISKRCGKVTIRTRTDQERTRQQADAGMSGERWTSEIHDLLTIDEAARLFARDDDLLRQLVVIGGGAPGILQRAYYDKHELFKGRADEERGSVGP